MRRHRARVVEARAAVVERSTKWERRVSGTGREVVQGGL
mgnify:CR=1 FL=1